MMNINDWVTLAVGSLAFITGFVKLSRGFTKFDRQLEKINYVLFNEGKTGLVNKVDILIENQACIKTDIAVLKAHSDK